MTSCLICYCFVNNCVSQWCHVNFVTEKGIDCMYLSKYFWLVVCEYYLMLMFHLCGKSLDPADSMRYSRGCAFCCILLTICCFMHGRTRNGIRCQQSHIFTHQHKTQKALLACLIKINHRIESDWSKQRLAFHYYNRAKKTQPNLLCFIIHAEYSHG